MVAGHSGEDLVGLAEAVPVLLEVTPQLADPGGAESVLVGHVESARAQHEILDDAAIPLTAAAQPGREVQAEADLLGDGRLRVVAEPLLQGVLRLLTVGDTVAVLVGAAGRLGQRLDTEVMTVSGP